MWGCRRGWKRRKRRFLPNRWRGQVLECDEKCERHDGGQPVCPAVWIGLLLDGRQCVSTASALFLWRDLRWRISFMDCWRRLCVSLNSCRLLSDKADRLGGGVLGRSLRVVSGGCVFVPVSVVGVSAGDYGMKIFGQSYIFC